MIRFTIIFFSTILFLETFNSVAQESIDSENKGHAEQTNKQTNKQKNKQTNKQTNKQK